MRYSANRDCPVFEELASILRMTSGLVDVLVEALSSVEKDIALAFVFGSVTRGEQQSNSDVDVMLVGNLGFADAVSVYILFKRLSSARINPMVYSLEELGRRVASRDSFIQEVLSQPKLFVVVNKNELEKLTQDQ
ncbi:MAG: nucleotidyltransferase domain-containing protein [Nitrosomonas sp.]|nr:nucleotidyltransferase domain-containing protein [Nitrosomonas sp.]